MPEMNKMPDHITDGPQLPEDVPGYVAVDEDEQYELYKQQRIDDEQAEKRAKETGRT